MGIFKFEGAIDGISERQLEFVSSVLYGLGFSNETVQVSVVGKADDNYAANVKRFVVEKDGTVFKMVAKIAPANELLRNRMLANVLFQNEHVMYTNVLPTYTELEKGADVPENERLKYPICYGSLFEEPNEIILLEDLQVSNFGILDKYTSLTDETVKLILKNFARLHSLSYALKKQEPDTYEGYKNKLVNRWAAMGEVPELKMMLSMVEANVTNMVDNVKYKNMLKGSVSQLLSLAKKNYNIDKDSKYAVIQHGDSWTNNILFSLEGEKTVDCCMIDYQLSTQNSPVADIHYMIFSSTDYKTRSKHYHEWIDYYHEQLDKCLSNFGLKASFIYPRDQFDADLKRFGKVSFGFGIMLTSSMMRDTQEAIKMKEAMQSDNNMDELMKLSLTGMVASTMVRFKARVEGLVSSFIELGYL